MKVKKPYPGKNPQVNAANTNRLNTLAKDGFNPIFNKFMLDCQSFSETASGFFSRVGKETAQNFIRLVPVMRLLMTEYPP